MNKTYFFYPLYALAFLLVISSCLGPATRVHLDEDDLPDETVVIIVETEMDNETAYNTIVQSLEQRGYTFTADTEIIDGIPVDFYGIAERWTADFVNIRLGIGILGEKDAEITIRGWYTALEYEGYPEVQEDQMIVIREGFGGSIGRDAWIEMFDLASEIEGIMRFEQ